MNSAPSDVDHGSPAAPIRKVVLCTSDHGYSLSTRAHADLRALGHADPETLPRDHPHLIAVVERLGTAAGGPTEDDPLWSWGSARLRVAAIPADGDWIIEGHHGVEWAVIGTRWTEEGPIAPDESQPWRRTTHP